MPTSKTSKLDQLTKSLLVNNLQKEYNIIQNKIDKIADFEFKIKGWCVTLTTVILGATINSKDDFNHPYLTLVFTFLLALVFHLIEEQQQFNKHILTTRALSLEKVLNKLIFNTEPDGPGKDRREFLLAKEINSTPRLGIALRQGGRQKGKFRVTLKKLFTPNKFNFFFPFLYITTMIVAVILFFTTNASPCGIL